MNAYRGLVVLFATVTIVLGLAILVVTISHGGGEVGILLGVMFIAAGAGRLWLARRRS